MDEEQTGLVPLEGRIQRKLSFQVISRPNFMLWALIFLGGKLLIGSSPPKKNHTNAKKSSHFRGSKTKTRLSSLLGNKLTYDFVFKRKM